jgi:hypothetical protein
MMPPSTWDSNAVVLAAKHARGGHGHSVVLPDLGAVATTGKVAYFQRKRHATERLRAQYPNRVLRP